MMRSNSFRRARGDLSPCLLSIVARSKRARRYTTKADQEGKGGGCLWSALSVNDFGPIVIALTIREGYDTISF
jgi:hypothetical protein